MKKNYLLKNIFIVLEDGKISDDSKISNGHISGKDYSTCKKNWDKFEMKNMGDFHDHYWQKDVLLLVDVFERFIDMCLKYYVLDPSHYFCCPGLCWDAILKMTGVELEKISDIDKHLYIEKGLSEGISCSIKRYAQANNKYLNDYDPKKESTFTTYLDINNLCECAMSGYLQILKVDLEYPYQLHELNNNFPFLMICCQIIVKKLLIKMK